MSHTFALVGMFLYYDEHTYSPAAGNTHQRIKCEAENHYQQMHYLLPDVFRK